MSSRQLHSRVPRTARSVDVKVTYASALMSEALKEMVARRLRNLYVCQGARVELGPEFYVEIGVTSPSRCVVLVKRSTTVRVTFVERNDEGEEYANAIETEASDAVENMLSSRSERTAKLPD